jgi:hypothetical protein
MKIFKRKEEKVQIELSDGTIKELTIKEQLRDVLDKVWDLQIDIAVKVMVKIDALKSNNIIEQMKETVLEVEKEQEKETKKIASKILDVIDNEKIFLEEELRNDSEIIKIITEEEDISWVEKTYPSSILNILEVFESVNPYFMEKKRVLGIIHNQSNM